MWLVGPGQVPVVSSIEVLVAVDWVDRLPGRRKKVRSGMSHRGLSLTCSLPQGPHAIHHAVVHPKSRVTGRGEQVGARITADRVVHASVRANLDCVGDAFGKKAVLGNIGLQKQVYRWLVDRSNINFPVTHTEHSGVVGVSLVHGRSDISLQSAGVVAETAIRAGGRSFKATDGAEIDSHVCERTGGHEATSDASGQLDVTAADSVGRCDHGAIMGHVVSVAAETVRVSVENGRLLGSRSVLRPIPVLSLRVSSLMLGGVFPK